MESIPSSGKKGKKISEKKFSLNEGVMNKMHGGNDPSRYSQATSRSKKIPKEGSGRWGTSLTKNSRFALGKVRETLLKEEKSLRK